MEWDEDAEVDVANLAYGPSLWLLSTIQTPRGPKRKGVTVVTACASGWLTGGGIWRARGGTNAQHRADPNPQTEHLRSRLRIGWGIQARFRHRRHRFNVRQY
jgi:hypothetical protein